MAALAEAVGRRPTPRFKHILNATDFSAVSQAAFEYAVAIAHQYGCTISVLHAIPPDPHEPAPIYPLPRELDRKRLEAEEHLEQPGEKIGNINHHLLLRRGRVCDVLKAAIEHENIDLLVLGTHGRGGLKKLALGSVAEERF